MWEKSWFDAGLYFEAEKENGGGGNGDDDGKTSDDKATDDKKFSQAEMDRIIGERVKRAEETSLKQLFEKLGVKDADELGGALGEFKKLREQQMSDLEKAQAAAKDAQAKIEQAERERTEAIERATQTLMRAAVLAEASKPEYRFKAEALGDVWTFVKRDSIKQKDGADGEFVGIGEALKALAKEKSYLVAEGDGRGTPRPGARKQGDQKQESHKGFTL